jgi:galactokinase
MFIAGRIEFLGKHTDYCGGQSIVCAIDRGFSVAASASRRGSLVITDEVSGETLTIPFAENAANETAGWAIYPAIVASRVARNFADEIKSGVTVSFRSDLPHAAGLSSSSALITAIFCAVAEHSGIAASEKYKRNISTKADLAEFLGCIENGTGFKELAGASGVGTFGGSQDHAAIVGSTSGTLSHFTFSPLEKLGKFSFPAEFCFAIASSGVVAEKTGAAMARYNNLSRMARAIVDAWPEKGNSLASIIRAYGIESVADNLRNTKSEFSRRDLENRLRAFYEESFEIIPAVAV